MKKLLTTALKVIKKIEEHGYEAYIVGGYVRDHLMGLDSNDVDICTNAKPKELIKIFEGAILPAEDYGSVTIYIKNNRFEITTFRREISYNDYRRPVEIEYIDDNETEEYSIVGSTEADPFENRISNESPIAKAILGKKAGETVSVESPNGSYDVKIVSIK